MLCWCFRYSHTRKHGSQTLPGITTISPVRKRLRKEPRIWVHLRPPESPSAPLLGLHPLKCNSDIRCKTLCNTVKHCKAFMKRCVWLLQDFIYAYKLYNASMKSGKWEICVGSERSSLSDFDVSSLNIPTRALLDVQHHSRVVKKENGSEAKD